MVKKYDTVGVDLVAMSVDDVVVLGPSPSSSWTISLSARSCRPCWPTSSRASFAAAARPAAPSSAGRRPSFPASTAREDGTWPVSASGSWMSRRSSTAGPAGPGTPSSAWLRAGSTATAIPWPARSFRPKRSKRVSGGSFSGRQGSMYRHPRGPQDRPHQVHGPHHGRRLLRQYPPGHPRGFGVRVEKVWPIPPIFRKIQRAGQVERGRCTGP